jgi:hypothetical protein
MVAFYQLSNIMAIIIYSTVSITWYEWDLVSYAQYWLMLIHGDIVGLIGEFEVML